MTLGQRIYQYRRGSGLSQEELAESLNVSRQSVSKWETDSSVPDLDKLVALSELFGITLDELVKGEVIITPVSVAEPAADADDVEPTVEAQPIQRAHTPEKFWCTRRIVGAALLISAFFFGFLLLILNVDIFESLICLSPIWVCGIICFVAQRHPLLCCLWGGAVSVSSFFAMQSVFRFYNFNLLTTIYAGIRFEEGSYISSNPLALTVHVAASCLIIALMIITVIVYSKEPIRLDRKALIRYGIIAGVYILLDIVITCFGMEMYDLLFDTRTNVGGDLYRILNNLYGVLNNVQVCMRPIAFTALVSVIASLAREKIKGTK